MCSKNIAAHRDLQSIQTLYIYSSCARSLVCEGGRGLSLLFAGEEMLCTPCAGSKMTEIGDFLAISCGCACELVCFVAPAAVAVFTRSLPYPLSTDFRPLSCLAAYRASHCHLAELYRTCCYAHMLSPTINMSCSIGQRVPGIL